MNTRITTKLEGEIRWDSTNQYVRTKGNRNIFHPTIFPTYSLKRRRNLNKLYVGVSHTLGPHISETTGEFLRGGVTLPFPLAPPLLFGLDSPASFFCNTYCTEHNCLRFLVLTQRENLLFCCTVSKKKRKNEMKKEKQKKTFFSLLCAAVSTKRTPLTPNAKRKSRR